MSVQLTPEVRWISECLDMGDRHVHASVFLVKADDGYVLIDSGSFHDRDSIRSEIEMATDGQGIDALVLSHADMPHSANATEFQSEWDGVELVASTGRPDLQGLADATRAPIGGTMEILGRKIEFVDPPLADRQHTVWIYDSPSKILFTADAFGDYHVESECEATSAEIEGGISLDDVARFHRETLPWLQFVDPALLKPAIEEVIVERELEMVAPIHGNPIERADLSQYVDTLIEAVGEIASRYEPPAFRAPEGRHHQQDE